jgi:hypothetical protein
MSVFRDININFRLPQNTGLPYTAGEIAKFKMNLMFLLYFYVKHKIPLEFLNK